MLLRINHQISFLYLIECMSPISESVPSRTYNCFSSGQFQQYQYFNHPHRIATLQTLPQVRANIWMIISFSELYNYLKVCIRLGLLNVRTVYIISSTLGSATIRFLCPSVMTRCPVYQHTQTCSKSNTRGIKMAWDSFSASVPPRQYRHTPVVTVLMKFVAVLIYVMHAVLLLLFRPTISD